MGTVSVRPLFRKIPTRKRGEGIRPIPTHSRFPFSHSISFCHCSFSAPWWARHTPREILRGGLPRDAPFFSRSPFVVIRRRLAVFLPSCRVYAESRACDAHGRRLDARNAREPRELGRAISRAECRSISVTSRREYGRRVDFFRETEGPRASR